MPAGRPTKYDEKFCELLIKHMSQGLSFESFAAQCDCHWDSLYEWVKVYPEFSEAKKIGMSKALEVWEKIGMQGTIGKIRNFNTGSWIFNMKNRFRWADKIEVSGAENAIPILLNYKLDADE